MSEPSCPSCGVSMVKRVARNGRYRGQSFWGCKNYPKCKEIKKFEGEADIPTAPDVPSDPAITHKSKEKALDIPRPVLARGITKHHTAKYFDSIAFPRWLVREYARDEEKKFNYSWRLDLPDTEVESHDDHPAIDTTLAFLLRGSVTSASDFLTHATDLNEAPGEEYIEDLLGELPDEYLHGDTVAYDRRIFDSDEEHAFYRHFTKRIQELSLAITIVPQVSLETLVSDEEYKGSGRRVDFLIAGAEGSRKVVELDGYQHEHSKELDASRDDALKDSGIEVVRIPTTEVNDNLEGAVDNVLQQLSGLDNCWSEVDSDLTNLQLLSQLQISVLVAMREGVLATAGEVRLSIDTTNIMASPSGDLIDVALQDLKNLLDDVAISRGFQPPDLKIIRSNDDKCCRISFGSGGPPDNRAIYIHNSIQFAVPLVALSSNDPVPFLHQESSDRREPMRRLLQRCYGFEDFREGQFEAIDRLVFGRDTLLLLPTGAGKSATYQLAALIRGGLCLVVDPLLSLIDDQIQNLCEHGISRCCGITSQVGTSMRKELTNLMQQGHATFVFVSPERLQDQAFRESLNIGAAIRGFALVAIDEAHCVSEWGHDFRPAYLNVATTIRRHTTIGDGQPPPVLGMTGTASYTVLRDIQRELAITDPNAQIAPNTFDRKELRFELIQCLTSDKGKELQLILSTLHKKFGKRSADVFWRNRKQDSVAGLVFCPHVNGKHGVVDVGSLVSKALPKVASGVYSGGSPKGQRNWDLTKQRNAANFKRDAFQILTCTKSFGMGIDKPNIRFTLHWGIPASLESFYQEAGRAGRDRKEAKCFLLVSDDNPDRSDLLLQDYSPPDNTRLRDASDIDRQLWFHRKSFPDKEEETSQLRDLVIKVTTADERIVTIPFAGFDNKNQERAIFRMLKIGVAEDYEKDWQGKQFKVRKHQYTASSIIDCFSDYLTSFNRKLGSAKRSQLMEWCARNTPDVNEVAIRVCDELVDFTYEQIEGTRRRALAEMRRVAVDSGNSENKFRQAMLAYLSTSAFSTMLQSIIEDNEGGLEGLASVFERIESPLDATDLASQSARLLTSIFNQPGLLVAHAIATISTTEPKPLTAVADIKTALNSAEQFGVEKEQIVSAFDQATLQLNTDSSLVREFANQFLQDKELDPGEHKESVVLLCKCQNPAIREVGHTHLVKPVVSRISTLLETIGNAL
ncbi:MAG: RecQ family ATP-dependent DNA helicase [Pirellulales bacterium]